MVYTVPIFTALLGNLWRFSTAKLESRGARCKKIMRRQTSARPRSIAKREHTLKATTIGRPSESKPPSLRRHKKRLSNRSKTGSKTVVKKASSHRQSYNSSQSEQLLAKVAIVQKLALSGSSAASNRRAVRLQNNGKEWTKSAKAKLAPKLESTDVPPLVAHLVGAMKSYSISEVLRSILLGNVKPLYSTTGIFGPKPESSGFRYHG